jgi:hypothetical protein
MLLALAIAAVVILPSVIASRFDFNDRSVDIDIDICVRCTQPEDARQLSLHFTIMLLKDRMESSRKLL